MFGRFKDQVRRLADVARGVPTIEQLVTSELDHHLPQEVALGEMSASTLTLYRRHARHVIERWGSMRPGDLDLGQMRCAMMHVQHRANWNIWMALLGRALRRAHDEGVIDQRPRLPRFRPNYREARVLPDEYPRCVETLHEMLGERGRSAHDPSSCRALLLVTYTGCRLSEARFLEWERVYLDLRLIRCGEVKRQEARYGLCDPAVKLLRETPRLSTWCFPGRRDASKPISRMHYTWAEVRRRVGLQQHVTIHGLRHSWITAAASHGSLEQIRRAVNHSSVHMSARYSHLAIVECLPLVDRVGKTIAGGSSDDA